VKVPPAASITSPVGEQLGEPFRRQLTVAAEGRDLLQPFVCRVGPFPVELPLLRLIDAPVWLPGVMHRHFVDFDTSWPSLWSIASPSSAAR
jgi:hypothetical protein